MTSRRTLQVSRKSVVTVVDTNGGVHKISRKPKDTPKEKMIRRVVGFWIPIARAMRVDPCDAARMVLARERKRRAARLS